MEIFQDYAYYYNLLYQDKPYAKEAETVLGLLKQYGDNIHSVLNLGCGTGRHDRELSRLGCRVKGIDLSREMIHIAQASAEADKESGPEFVTADIRDFRDGESYDAAVSLFHVMSYQTENKDLLAALRTAGEELAPGGIFLFDVWYGPGVLTDRPAVRVKKLEDDRNEILRIAQPVMHPNENIVDVCYQILITDKKTSKSAQIRETHRMRYFFQPEIKICLEQEGFELLACLDCSTLEKCGFDTWTAYFVAKKV